MTPRFALLLAVALAAPTVTVVGCSVRVSNSTDDSAPTVNNAYGLDASADGSMADASFDVVAAPTYQGSPLCNASRDRGCYPDNPPDDPTTAKTCNLAPDGGPYSAAGGYDGVALACHVHASSDTTNGLTVQPVCTAAGPGTDGTACKGSGDCGPGLECVGNGTCMHYCCAGNIECGTREFCDIQPMAQASMTKVPVCMPIHPLSGCDLLKDTQGAPCAPTETCAVVRENGVTGCVAIGTAQAGDACDKEHCAAGLACLGTPGDRLCYQLCHTATSAECSGKQACKGGLPLFPDPSVGICQ